MSGLTRFSISLEKALLEKFDLQLKQDGCPTRSKGVADLVRESLVKHEWKGGREVAGAVLMVYDHHKRDLSNKLTNVQHDFHHLIISSQHIHLDHDNCLEMVVVRGKPRDVEVFYGKMKGTKGVKYANLAIASTGKAL